MIPGLCQQSGSNLEFVLFCSLDRNSETEVTFAGGYFFNKLFGGLFLQFRSESFPALFQ